MTSVGSRARRIAAALLGGAGRADRRPAVATPGMGERSAEEELIVSVLTTGHRPSGRVPRRPMPPFRLTPEDARAIAADLRALATR